MADELEVLVSAARTATVQSTQQAAPTQFKGMYLLIDVTAITATPSITINLEAHDDMIGAFFSGIEHQKNIDLTVFDKDQKVYRRGVIYD